MLCSWEEAKRKVLIKTRRASREDAKKASHMHKHISEDLGE
jgi:hypothetical protein